MDLEKLFDRQDKILDKITQIDITLAKQEVSIEHHIKRTAIAEENIELLRNDLKPIKRHVQTVDILIKLAGGVSAFVSFSLGLLKLYEILFK